MAAVTWIRVEKPTFDLVGVLVSSLELTGVILVAALAFGIVLGVSLILRRRRSHPRFAPPSLSLSPEPPPS